MRTGASRPNWVPMVGHAFRVLESFAAPDVRLSLKEVIARAGIAKTSAFRIVSTLVDLGYLVRGPGSAATFALGPRLPELAASARPRRSAVELAEPHLRALADACGETVNLGALQDDAVVYVAVCEGKHPFRLASQIGTRTPLHAAALAKVLLAFQPEGRQRALLERCGFERRTPRTITSRTRLRAVLADVRRRGHATDDEEVERGATCLACPVLGSDGQAQFAVSVSGPTHRIRSQQPALLARLRHTSANLAATLAARAQ